MTMVETRRTSFSSGAPQCHPAATHVTVLMGGTSAEREVSLLSGREVSKALRSLGFMVKDVDLHPDEVRLLAGREFDVAFIALHGGFGEDGTLQRQLDRLGLAYTGSGAEASRLAMDKVAAKERFLAAGVGTPEWRLAARGDAAGAREVYDALGPAVAVKPRDDGSSVAVTLAERFEDYRAGLDEVFKIRGEALVERLVRGRELTVGVLADQGLPIIEIIPAAAFYNYEAKYLSDATRYVADPELPAGLAARVQAMAVAAHRSLGCRDFSRVDVMVDAAGEPTVLEVNTIPGFTTHSLLPKAAAAAGLDFAALCRTMVELALCRKTAGRRS
jgi:D-alanine-D-alanine ligase